MSRLLTRKVFAVGLLVAAAGGAAAVAMTPAKPTAVLPDLQPEPAEASEAAVRQACGHCHAYPPPDTFPRSSWRKEVAQGIDFFHQETSQPYRFVPPPLEAVVRYYESRAPEALAPQPAVPSAGTPRGKFEPRELPFAQAAAPPGVTHVTTARLFSKDKADVIVCDAISQQVLVYSPYESPPAWRAIARGVCGTHADVADLDGDGILDIVVACLGRFQATDDRVGSVVWLRGAADRSFTQHTLADGLGRVADARVADFTGDGRPDIVVAEFGWHKTGGILLLEQKPTADRAKPTFEVRTLDPRHGTTHVPVCDLNGDGKPDFVAVISQEHESVVAFLNEGGGRFRTETIYAGPHPAFGCNGVTLADLDGDGDLDVVLSNGDPLDPPYLLRPDHGVQWLENTGKYPFTPHRLAFAYGAGSPVVADFDGNGLPDVAFVGFLPSDLFPHREGMDLPAVVLLEQTSKGQFARNVLEAGACDYAAAAVADLDGDGRPDLLVGRFSRSARPGRGLAVWQNRTAK